MYVPKVPRRYDFCGCPPCGLCFDWVEPVPPVEVKEEEPIAPPEELPRVDGIDKAAMDLTGKPLGEITTEEKAQVKDYMDDFHSRAFNDAMKGKPPGGDGEVFVDGEDLEWFEKRIAQQAQANEAERRYQEQLNKPKVLDHMDLTGVEEEAEKENEKALEKAAKDEAAKERRREKEAEAARKRELERLYNRFKY